MPGVPVLPPLGGFLVAPVVPAEPVAEALVLPVAPLLAEAPLSVPALWFSCCGLFNGGSGKVLVLIGVVRSQLAPPRRRSPDISSTPSLARGVRS